MAAAPLPWFRRAAFALTALAGTTALAACGGHPPSSTLALRSPRLTAAPSTSPPTGGSGVTGATTPAVSPTTEPPPTVPPPTTPPGTTAVPAPRMVTIPSPRPSTAEGIPTGANGFGLVEQAMTDAERIGTYRVWVTGHAPGKPPLRSSGEGNAHQGSLTSTYGGAQIEQVVDYDATYVLGDATGVEGLGLPATDASQLAHRWVLLTTQDQGYAAAGAAVDLPNLLGQLGLRPPDTLAPAQVGSTQLLEVSGPTIGSSGTETVYLTRGPDPLPYEAVTDEFGMVRTFLMHWGGPITLPRTRGAVEASQLLNPSPS